MNKLVFATHNKNKLQEMKEIMEGLYEVVGLDDIGCYDEIVEDGTTLEENADIKADYVTEHFHLDCFADDTGLEVEALGGAPGIYSARYAGEHCTYQDNVDKMLAAMQGVTNRKAAFRTVIALNLGGKKYHLRVVVMVPSVRLRVEMAVLAMTLSSFPMAITTHLQCWDMR